MKPGTIRLLLFLLISSCPLLVQAQTYRPGFNLPENERRARIPVEIQHNVIIVPVRINGSFEMNFILDTGVKSTILTEPFLSQFLQLDSITKVRVRGLGEGDAIEAILARDVTINFAGISGDRMNLLVLPEDVIDYSGMFGRPVYGIIGHDIFSQFVVTINYSRKYIELHDPVSFRPGRREEAIPIDIRNGKPYIEAVMTDFRGEKITGQWLMDTGSSNAISLYDEELPVPEPSIPAFLGKGLSGNVFGRLARAPEFQIGPYVFENVIAGYPDSNSLNLRISDTLWYGNVGAEVLSRFQVTFDYFRRTVYLRQHLGWRQDFEYNVSGLEVMSEGDFFNKFKIIYVRPGSPADEAGVRIGDELISINGLETGSMDISTLYASLLSRNGRKMALRLRRNGEILRKKFDLIPEI